MAPHYSRDRRRASELPTYGDRRFHSAKFLARFATFANGYVAFFTTDACSANSYIFPMKLSPVHQWVSDALDAAKLKQAEAARRLSAELRRNIDRAAVNKM